jgi:hypothetical protein
MNLVVGLECSVLVAGGQRIGEAAVGLAHRGDVVGPQLRHGDANRKLVHGGDHFLCIVHSARLDLGDHGASPRDGDHEPDLAEPQQGLADRCPAHPQPRGELAVVELLAGAQASVDDLQTQLCVDRVAQEGPADRRVGASRHAIYCAAHRVPCQGVDRCSVASSHSAGRLGRL